VYDLGDFPEAIRLYGEAAFKYQDDPSALAAYVQIVNANVALGRLEEAKAANERAKWMLRRMPPEAFTASGATLGMPQAYWEQWLRWSGEAGIWK
jgi:tetratricopeptide (TPR) repeat protein